MLLNFSSLARAYCCFGSAAPRPRGGRGCLWWGRAPTSLLYCLHGRAAGINISRRQGVFTFPGNSAGHMQMLPVLWIPISVACVWRENIVMLIRSCFVSSMRIIRRSFGGTVHAVKEGVGGRAVHALYRSGRTGKTCHTRRYFEGRQQRYYKHAAGLRNSRRKKKKKKQLQETNLLYL